MPFIEYDSFSHSIDLSLLSLLSKGKYERKHVYQELSFAASGSQAINITAPSRACVIVLLAAMQTTSNSDTLDIILIRKYYAGNPILSLILSSKKYSTPVNFGTVCFPNLEVNNLANTNVQLPKPQLLILYPDETLSFQVYVTAACTVQTHIYLEWFVIPLEARQFG
jgi:hypothetical protein